MPFHAAIIAAEFREQHRAAKAIRRKAVWFEINMQALHIPDPLIVPPACMVDGARFIHLPDPAHGFRCIELTPALVERHPHGHGRAVVKQGDHLLQFFIVFPPALRILPRETAVILLSIRKVLSRDERQADRGGFIRSAPVRHVLPDEHTKPVAMIIPAQRFNLDMLAQHVEAHFLHGLNVMHHRFIRRRGI